jgi:hypothetical protein
MIRFTILETNVVFISMSLNKYIVPHKRASHLRPQSYETPNVAQATCYRSAGVVPFSVDPFTQTTYVLLIKSDAGQSHSGQWSDFGGMPSACDKGEELRTASREFCEESLCVLRLNEFDGVDDYNGRMESILARLVKEEFYFALDQITYHPTSATQAPIRRKIFLLRVPWQPDVVHSFSRTRVALHNATKDHVPERVRHHPAVCELPVAKDWLEKTEVRWFSLDFLADALRDKPVHEGLRVRYSFQEFLRIIVRKLCDARNEQRVA